MTDLLTGAGKTSYSVPGALYFARDFVKAKDDPETPDAQDLVNIPDTIDEFTVTYSKVFLGINLSCVSCHNGKGHLEKAESLPGAHYSRRSSSSSRRPFTVTPARS